MTLPAKLDPIPPIDRNAPDLTTPSRPLWLTSRLDAMRGDWRQPTLPARAALSPPQRAECERHERALIAFVADGEARMIGAAVATMLACFPAQAASDEALKARAHGYLTALADLPAWAVDRGASYWMRREHAEGRENYAFAPSPPELRRLAVIAARPLRAERHAIRRLLKARVEAEPVIDPARWDALSASLAGNPSGENVNRESPGGNRNAENVNRSAEASQ